MVSLIKQSRGPLKIYGIRIKGKALPLGWLANQPMPAYLDYGHARKAATSCGNAEDIEVVRIDVERVDA